MPDITGDVNYCASNNVIAHSYTSSP